MKPATSLKFASPKSAMSSVALAAALLMYAAPAAASWPTIDVSSIANLAASMATKISTAATAASAKISAAEAVIKTKFDIAKKAWDESEIIRKATEVTESVNKLQTMYSDLSDKWDEFDLNRTSMDGVGAPVDYTPSKIAGMYKSTAMSLTAPAARFFPNPDACKNDKPVYQTAIGTVVNIFGVGVQTLEDKLEANCVAQRELTAMGFQAAYDYSKVVAGLKQMQKTSSSLWSTLNAAENSENVKTAIAAHERVSSLAHETYDRTRELIKNQELLLKIVQRDLEVEQLRGRKGVAPNLVSSAVKTLAVTAGLAGVVSSRAVDGNRTSAYKATYAD